MLQDFVKTSCSIAFVALGYFLAQLLVPSSNATWTAAIGMFGGWVIGGTIIAMVEALIARNRHELVQGACCLIGACLGVFAIAYIGNIWTPSSPAPAGAIISMLHVLAFTLPPVIAGLVLWIAAWKLLERLAAGTMPGRG